MIMETIVSNNLRILRENGGYTQKQVADFLGVNRSAYANYESGSRETPVSVLEGGANLCGVEVSVFFEEDPAAVQSRLLCAFRADDLGVEDMKQVAEFKAVAMNYLKMIKLLENE